jgi:formamidopyrimidine-DNA glycosylase
MPELPEVETVCRGLNKLIIGKTIGAVFADNPKSFPVPSASLKQDILGFKVLKVSRRAKIILVDLSSGCTLMAHLKMTGQMVYRGGYNWGGGHPSDSLVGGLPDKTTRIIFEFSDGTKLFFNDQRKFGWVKLFNTKQVDSLPNIAKLGPEPLSPMFTSQVFTTNLAKRKGSGVKAVLLDQTIISGIGNIYADEVLFNSHIHPETRVANLTATNKATLRQEIIKVLNLSLSKGGSTSKNYVNAEGKKGNYLDFANVYARQGQPCKTCQTPISKIRVASRGTHVCLNCQKKR